MNDANCSVELSTAWTFTTMIHSLDLDELEVARAGFRSIPQEENPNSNVATLAEASRDKSEAWRLATADHIRLIHTLRHVKSKFQKIALKHGLDAESEKIAEIAQSVGPEW